MHQYRMGAMDVRFISPFIVGIQNVFTTMLDTQVLVSKPFLKEDDTSIAGIFAIIGYSGQVTGSVALCYPMKTAIKVASKFTDTEITQHHPDFPDALGELANMVAGQAKSKFPSLEVGISLPRIVVGRELRLLGSHSTPILVFTCDSTLGRFSAEVSMTVQGQRADQESPVLA